MLFLLELVPGERNWQEDWLMGYAEAEDQEAACRKFRIDPATRDGNDYFDVPSYLLHHVSEGCQGGVRVRELTFFRTITELKDVFGKVEVEPPEQIYREEQPKRRKGKRRCKVR